MTPGVQETCMKINKLWLGFTVTGNHKIGWFERRIDVIEGHVLNHVSPAGFLGNIRCGTVKCQRGKQNNIPRLCFNEEWTLRSSILHSIVTFKFVPQPFFVTPRL